MKLEILQRSEEEVNECDYTNAITFKLTTNKEVLDLKFHDGEPEDNFLSRNFNDIYLIRNLIEAAYFAGKNNEMLEISDEESSDL